MAASTAIDPALVERFKAALDRLNPDGGKIGLAVSGGPDSMAMLLLAHEAIPGAFEVATVDHGLRPEAKDECALVLSACEERAVPCEVLTVTVAEGNVQARAREARYDALANWFCGPIATAHHADDQAETLLMRLNRGSGLRGLAGVREAFDTEHYIATIIRPLLQFRRDELAEVIRQAGVIVATDPSNVDDRFERARLRKEMRQAGWLDPLAIGRSALHLAEADEALNYETRRFWESHVERVTGKIRLRLHPARAIRLRLTEMALGELGGRPDGGEVARLDKVLMSGGKANLAGVLAELLLLEDGPTLQFSPEPPRRTG